MRELSLFTGAGGGLLGSHLLGWRPIGYVEINDYCQRIIAARIRDGLIPMAPIFSDVEAFIGEGYAERYRGMVDVVSAGFPCQPFSAAGKRRASDDERNQWPTTAEVIRITRPQWIFLENVPGLLAASHGYFGEVLRSLAAMGYDARWGVLGASDVGAPHLRKRLWIAGTSQGPAANAVGDSLRLKRQRYREQCGQQGQAESLQNGEDWSLANPDSGRRKKLRQQEPSGKQSACRDEPDGCNCPAEMADSDLRRCRPRSKQREVPGEAFTEFENGSWWKTEPDVGRVVDGLAYRVDRLRALGNGQVPTVVRLAWETLTTEDSR